LDAVGTRVTSRPPHRTVRAAFPHTAPTSGPNGKQLPHAFPAPVTREPGAESSACFAGPHSPWSPPFAPPTPLRIAPLCSSASQLLSRSATSRARASSPAFGGQLRSRSRKEMFPECIPVATLDRVIVPKWGANAKRVHEPKGTSEPRRANRLRAPMGRYPGLHHSTTAPLSGSIRDRRCTHGPRHDTGNAVPESNLKSRVGCRRAVARRADNQARAMAAIAGRERKNGSALTSEARQQGGVSLCQPRSR
jgi:hypothetical protein